MGDSEIWNVLDKMKLIVVLEVYWVNLITNAWAADQILVSVSDGCFTSRGFS